MRWVASTFRSMKIIFENWKGLVKHLEKVSRGESYSNTPFSKEAKDKANAGLFILKTRDFLTTMALELDLAYVFKVIIDIFYKNTIKQYKWSLSTKMIDLFTTRKVGASVVISIFALRDP